MAEDFKRNEKTELVTSQDNRASWMDAIRDFRKSGAPEMLRDEWHAMIQPAQVRDSAHLAGCAVMARNFDDVYQT